MIMEGDTDEASIPTVNERNGGKMSGTMRRKIGMRTTVTSASPDDTEAVAPTDAVTWTSPASATSLKLKSCRRRKADGCG